MHKELAIIVGANLYLSLSLAFGKPLLLLHAASLFSNINKHLHSLCTPFLYFSIHKIQYNIFCFFFLVSEFKFLAFDAPRSCLSHWYVFLFSLSLLLICILSLFIYFYFYVLSQRCLYFLLLRFYMNIFGKKILTLSILARSRFLFVFKHI